MGRVPPGRRTLPVAAVARVTSAPPRRPVVEAARRMSVAVPLLPFVRLEPTAAPWMTAVGGRCGVDRIPAPNPAIPVRKRPARPTSAPAAPRTMAPPVTMAMPAPPAAPVAVGRVGMGRPSARLRQSVARWTGPPAPVAPARIPRQRLTPRVRRSPVGPVMARDPVRAVTTVGRAAVACVSARIAVPSTSCGMPIAGACARLATRWSTAGASRLCHLMPHVPSVSAPDAPVPGHSLAVATSCAFRHKSLHRALRLPVRQDHSAGLSGACARPRARLTPSPQERSITGKAMVQGVGAGMSAPTQRWPLAPAMDRTLPVRSHRAQRAQGLPVPGGCEDVCSPPGPSQERCSLLQKSAWWRVRACVPIEMCRFA
jgi:hypothetical protein